MANVVDAGLSPLVPFKAEGDEEDETGFVRPGDRSLTDDDSGVLFAEAENGHHSRQSLPAKLNLTSAYALAVGSVIGAGIFSSPSRVDSSTPSPGVAISIWLTAGLVAWAGAVAFAELGSAIPRNGGMQEYLRYMYGDSVASIMSRTWILAARPSSTAVVSIVFAEYWTTMVFPSQTNSAWMTQLLAMTTILCILVINSVSVSISTRFTNVLLVSKLSTVALILILAFLAAAFNVSSDDEPSQDWKSKNWFTMRRKDVGADTIDWAHISTWNFLGYLTSAMYAALWAYSGFDSINIVAAEMKDPSRDLPRVVHFAMPTIVICYILTNLAYYVVIPWDEVSASKAIAVVVGKKTIGPITGLIFAILISISVLGVMNIDMYTGGIMTESAARRGYMPGLLARPENDDEIYDINARLYGVTEPSKIFGPVNRFLRRGLHIHITNTPIKAMVFNTAMVIPYVLLGSFQPLVSFLGMAYSTFCVLTVAGGLMLRFRQPFLKRPYQPNFLIPVFFCLISFLLVARSIILAPLQGFVLLLLVAFGSALHRFSRRLESAAETEMSSPLSTYGDER